MGGASRAFGLPQAAAKRILRAEARTHFPLTGSNASPPHRKACAAENNIRAERDPVIDNFLLTLAFWYGYPQKFLVCCRSR